jgi:hypothetical protein
LAPAAPRERQRDMLKMTRFTAVLGTVLVAAALGGFLALEESPAGTSTSGDRTEVTGYAASGIGGQRPDAISVNLDGAAAARIEQLAERLPPAVVTNTCAENAEAYRITFTGGAGTKQGLNVIGYRCGELVVEVPSRGRTSDRVDRNCALLSAVRRLLPARVTEIQASSCAGHVRLLAGVSSRGRQGGRDSTPHGVDRFPGHPRGGHQRTGGTGTGSAPGASKSHDEKEPSQRQL